MIYFFDRTIFLNFEKFANTRQKNKKNNKDDILGMLRNIFFKSKLLDAEVV